MFSLERTVECIMIDIFRNMMGYQMQELCCLVVLMEEGSRAKVKLKAKKKK